jgi:peptidoglycan hydrolase-like protein with peptidoglycan-binding domain
LRLPFGKKLFVGVCGLVIVAATCFAQNSTGSASPSLPKKKVVKRSRLAKAKKRGQQKIDNARTEAIQQALIRENYLKGEPSGSFDAATQAALQKYQADHGWQTRVVPDSRALINLGLGPDHDHLLNPETAMTSAPGKPHPQPAADQSDGQSQTQTH